MPIQPQMTPELAFEELAKLHCNDSIRFPLLEIASQTLTFYKDLSVQVKALVIYNFANLSSSFTSLELLIPNDNRDAREAYEKFKHALQAIAESKDFTASSGLNKLYRELTGKLQPNTKTQVDRVIGNTVRRIRLIDVVTDFCNAYSEVIRRLDTDLRPNNSGELVPKPEDLKYDDFVQATGGFAKVIDNPGLPRVSVAQSYVNLMPLLYNMAIQLMSQQRAIKGLYPPGAEEAAACISQVYRTMGAISSMFTALRNSDFLPKLRALREPHYFNEVKPSKSEAFNSISRAMFDENSKLIPVFIELSHICDTVMPQTLQPYLDRIKNSNAQLIHEITEFQTMLLAEHSALHGLSYPFFKEIKEAIEKYSDINGTPTMQELTKLRTAISSNIKSIYADFSDGGQTALVTPLVQNMLKIMDEAHDASVITSAHKNLQEARTVFSYWTTKHEDTTVPMRYAAFAGFDTPVPGTDGKNLTAVALDVTYTLRAVGFQIRSSPRPIDNANHISNVAENISERLARNKVPLTMMSLEIHTRANAYIPNPPDFV